MLILIVAGGPDKGRIYELHEEQPVILGREGDQIRLNDRKCSRKHAKIWAEGGKWYVRDLNSRHGTHVNATQVENKHELQDGDHVQIGSTLFVMARLISEQAERMALLGTTPTPMADAAPLARLVRPRVLAGGAAAAAALVIGSNAFLYLASKQQSDRLYAEIESTRTQTTQKTEQLLKEVRGAAGGSDALAAAGETQQTLKEILTAVQAQKAQEQLLTQIADAVKGQPEQAAMLRDVVAKLEQGSAPAEASREMLQAILANIEAQPKAAAKTQEMLAAVLERVEAQPAVDLQPLVAEVRSAAEAARQQQQALAARADQQEALLKDSLAQLKAPAAVDPAFADSLKQAVASSAGNAELLQRILENLDQQKVLAGEIGTLRTLVEAQPRATQTVLREIVQSLPAAKDDAAVLAAIDEIKRSLPADVSEKLEQVLERLDRPQGSPEGLAAALKAALDERQVVAADTMQRLVATIESQPTRDDLQKAVDAAAAKPAEQVLAALDAAEREPDPALLAKLDEITKQLEATRAAAAEDAGEDETAKAFAAATQQTQQLLTDVLAEVRNREPIDALRTDVQRLAEAQGKDPQQVLEQVLAAVKEQGDSSDADARLAEMHELIRSWPEQTESMLKEMVTAIAQANDPEGEAIQDVLGEIKKRAMARIDELDHAIRNDIRTGLSQELEAAAMPDPRRSARGEGGATRSAVLASPNLDPADHDSGLSKTKEAYRMAFETGQPLRIGAGVVNATTGEVSEGKTLDPVAAKAAGMKTWEQWYNYDEFAERMRLQKQAMRFSGDHVRSDVMTLPSNTAMPPIVEQATPAAPAAEAAPGTVSEPSQGKG